MGIGKLYWFAAAIYGTYLFATSHYKNWDGALHRPGNKASERRRRKTKVDEEQKEDAIREVARERGVTPERLKRKLKRESERTAPYYTKPDRPITDDVAFAKSAIKRDESESGSRGRHRRRDSGSSGSSEEYDPKSSSRPRRSALKGPVKRYRTAPFSEFIPEENFSQYTGNKPHWDPPLRAEHGTRRDSHKHVEMQDSNATSDNSRMLTAATEHEHLGQLSPALTENPRISFNATNTEPAPLQLGHTATNSNDSVLPRITFTKPDVHHLHMRHARSPKKLGKGRPSPLRINTSLPIPPDAPPSKRTRTEKKIEIEYDSSGTPRIRETPTTPTVLSPFLTSARPSSAYAPTPSSGFPLPSALPSAAFESGQALLALRGLQSPTAQAPAIRPKKSFGLIDAFIADSSLCILLVGYLDVPSLISLYAISKKFHYYFNKNATGFILSSMRTWAPGADELFPWRCYESLCIKDPIKRQKAKALVFGADVERLNLFSRDVPSLRWLQMVVWREGVVKDIMTQLVTKGLRTPRGSRDAIKRLWFMLDLPLNAHRLALMRCREYFSNKTLELLTHFLLKVDMFFTDPALALYRFNHPNQRVWPNRWANGAALGCNLREKLLAERSLTSLWRVMRGWSPDPAAGFRPIRAMDILNLWMRHQFRFRRNAPHGMDRTRKIMKKQMRDFMDTGYERIWRPETYDDDVPTPVTATAPRVNRPRPLLRPDELIMAESINRQLSLHREWTTMMLWGFVDPNGRDVRVPSEKEIISKTREHWTRREKIQMALAAQAAKDGRSVGDGSGIPPRLPIGPRPMRSKR
ncbi:uncharacterized protein MYCFIDRAFT_83526 [Pseudocercospora fijiensis CIRAD86]|uniref:Uncharacterized protein n=1 Tax=Pseudocercospora fijiensis (strain CIRAD86) TaxID=383855 RepID=M2YX05_PSEFD|nr:uncharacterized protein MYCFIDRAFT_83526 [Pseudocercospora fijiensis CIRAD86]EME82230.1 hypothetical protein MYCFIDRAFT_83526 [Pseudocercospora fijiensis CIRAD86]